MSIIRSFAERALCRRARPAVRQGLTSLGLVALLTATSLGQVRYYSNGPSVCPDPCQGRYPAYAPAGTVYGPSAPYSAGVPTPAQAPAGSQTATTPPGVTQAPTGYDTTMPNGYVSPEMFAASAGAGFGGAPASAAPAMIGDFIGSGGLLYPNSYYNAPGGSTPIAGGDRRFKIGENMTPVPTDRFFFTYNHFHNALVSVDPARDTLNNINFDRYTFGVEAASLFGGWSSLEVRIPFGDGLDSDQIGDPTGQNQFSATGTELGNVVLVAKSYLYRGCCGALTGGVAFVIPTADNARQIAYGGAVTQPTTMREVTNDSFHIQPFLGALWTPSCQWFVQGYVSADFDVTGYNVYQRDTPFEAQMDYLGNYDDQDLLHLDLKIGYWLFKNSSCHGWISGIAPTVELHYSTTPQNADEVSDSSGSPVVFSPLNRYDNLNITGGVHFLLHDQSTLTLFCAFPLKDDEIEFSGINSNFDAELGVQYNCYF